MTQKEKPSKFSNFVLSALKPKTVNSNMYDYFIFPYHFLCFLYLSTVVSGHCFCSLFPTFVEMFPC